ncbi:hypothetical protein LOK49_LG15G01392 [Camellia lanceoleosa]|uniref:Uncharacterized protein n=1 Tax=Camellia lanceoleosa TaxID=1840588 RepID=A0ACC0F7J6_9ERIC|nr:hypothetical protein LOK49_LG15G01392 [Camellia lanceoleosa]
MAKPKLVKPNQPPQQLDSQLQLSTNSISIEECSSYQHSDMVSAVPYYQQLGTLSYNIDHQEHTNPTDTICTGSYPTGQIDLTVVKTTHKHTQVTFPIPKPFHTSNLEDHQQKEPVPPDPSESQDGEARPANPTQLRGATTSETDQCSGLVVRARERNNSPRRFRLVDRANTVDNQTKLGEQPNKAISLDPNGLHASSGGRSPANTYAGNKTFKHNLVEILRSHIPEILILMETKVGFSKMGNFFTLLGRVSGIWLLWDTNQVNVRASSVGPQVIHATVHKEDYEEWVLTTVYASPNPLLREILWNELEEVANSMDKPWLVTGDFNDYANQSERRSYSKKRVRLGPKFLERINNRTLMDLGNSGPRMTWTNNAQGLLILWRNLDRALYNENWQKMFPEATVKVLPRLYLDHSPLVVHTQGVSRFCSLGNLRMVPEVAHLSELGEFD